MLPGRALTASARGMPGQEVFEAQRATQPPATAEIQACVQLEEAEEHKQRAAIEKEQYKVQLEAAKAEKRQCLEQAADEAQMKAAAAEQALQQAQAAMTEVTPHHSVTWLPSAGS